MEPERLAPRALERGQLVAIAAAFAGVALLGLLVVSHRFGFGGPALVDDWYYATQHKSPGDLLGLFFESTSNRYRPAYDALSYVQWHVLGAPQRLLAPNLVGVLRILLFAGAVAVIPGVIAATTRPRPRPLLLGALCLAGGVAVLACAATDTDFARLGPQEPLLLGATACGGAMLVWATGRVIAGREPGRGWVAITACAFIAGALFWLLGIYFKEGSLAVLVLAPFLYLHLHRRWREQGILQGPLWRARPFQLLAGGLLLSLFGVALGANSTSGSGVSLYGADKPDSLGEWLARLVDSAQLNWDLVGMVHMPEWRWAGIAIVLLLIGVGVGRRRIPWLELGLVVTAIAVLLLQGVVLTPESRYLIPGVGLFFMAGVLLLAQSPPWLGWLAVAAALVSGVVHYSTVRDQLDAWGSWETENVDPALDRTADLHPQSCPVYVMNLGLEFAEAIPQTLEIRDRPLAGPCRSGYEGTIFGFAGDPGGPLAADDAVARACAQRPTVLFQTGDYAGDRPPEDAIDLPLQILGCRHFSERLAGEPVSDVLRRNRLVPGLGMNELRERCAARYGDRRCFPELRTLAESLGR